VSAAVDMTSRERPILFSARMVRAILAGEKTQTRRVMKPQPGFDPERMAWAFETRRARISWSGARPLAAALLGFRQNCPYGALGDRLWVRETWTENPDEPSQAIYRADPEWEEIFTGWRWRSGMFMPRWASRLTLEITDVRVERVQSISEGDAREEGFGGSHEPRADFAAIWVEIHSLKSWNDNPWVWALTFRRRGVA
jgi:hypothetical protein